MLSAPIWTSRRNVNTATVVNRPQCYRKTWWVTPENKFKKPFLVVIPIFTLIERTYASDTVFKSTMPFSFSRSYFLLGHELFTVLGRFRSYSDFIFRIWILRFNFWPFFRCFRVLFRSLLWEPCTSSSAHSCLRCIWFFTGVIVFRVFRIL